MRNTSTSFVEKITVPMNLEGLSLADAKIEIDSIEKSLREQKSERYEIALHESDPLNHPDLDEIINYIAGKNILVYVITRGVELTEERIASWGGKVNKIVIYENLNRFSDEFVDSYDEGTRQNLPLRFARMESVARAVKIHFAVSDETLNRLNEEKKQEEYNMNYKFYKLNVFDKGLVERKATFYYADNASDEARRRNKSTLFPGEDSENYEIHEDGFQVTVRRTLEISTELARKIISEQEDCFDYCVTIEARSEDEAKKIFLEKYAKENRADRYEFLIGAETLDEAFEREAKLNSRDEYYEKLGREALTDARYSSAPAKRFRYEGMLIDAKRERVRLYMEHLFENSPITLAEFNTLLNNVYKADCKCENARGWKTLFAKYARKDQRKW
jgi:hypothetical protein